MGQNGNFPFQTETSSTYGLHILTRDLAEAIRDHFEGKAVFRGLIHNLQVLPTILQNGFRLKGIYTCCLSGLYLHEGQLLSIATLAFCPGKQSDCAHTQVEYHIGYIAPNAHNLDAVCTDINTALVLKDLQPYRWEDKGYARSAHLPKNV